MRERVSYFVFLASILLIRCSDAMISWFVTIYPHEEECYLLKAPPKMGPLEPVLVADYGLITEASPEPVMFYVMEERTHRLVYKKHGDPMDNVKITLLPKEGYWVCLQNSSAEPGMPATEDHEDDIPRKIGFSYAIEMTAPHETGVDVKTRDWHEHSSDIVHSLHQVEDMFRYLKVREADHRSLTEKNFSSVLNWTLLELAVVVAAAAGQVLYFRRFLEKKHSMMY